MSDYLYYTRESLADAAGVGMTAFKGHLKANVGGINAACEKIPGLGLRFNAKLCRKYLALNHANPKRKAKAQRIAAEYAVRLLNPTAEPVPVPSLPPPGPPATPTP